MKRPVRHNCRDRRHVSGCADVTERAVQMTGANDALDDRQVIRQRYTPNKLNQCDGCGLSAASGRSTAGHRSSAGPTIAW